MGETHTLLALVLQDEKVTSVLNELRQCAVQGKPFHIPPDDILYIKRRFQEGIELGEKGLHELCFQILRDMAELSKTAATLIVWGRCPDPDHPRIAKSYTRIELSHVLSFKYMDSMIAWTHSPTCSTCGKKTNTIASFNQYQVSETYPSGLRLLLSRIKTTSNVCYKIADMVFDIDHMFHRDKIHNRYTQSLMDMYGVKTVFEKDEHIQRAVDYFRDHRELRVLAEKDYLGIHRKKSGYEAYKAVIQKQEQIFEVQFQTLAMLEAERSSLTASHTTYKEKQMAERQKLGSPYKNLYDVLIQLFSAGEDPSV